MLTTSRREVTFDNIENESKEKLTFNDSALARERKRLRHRRRQA